MWLHDGHPVFISHSHKDLAVANRVKDRLKELGCSGFLAHEDIHVSEEWHDFILIALDGAHFFVSLWSENYLRSPWCLQEAGIAAANRNIIEVPLSIDGAMPVGFSGKKQAKKIRDQMPQIKDIVPGLLSGESCASGYAPFREVVEYVAKACSFRDAEDRMAILSPHYLDMPKDVVQLLANGILQNKQIYGAALCIEKYIPLFINICKPNLKRTQLRELRNVLDE